MTTPTTTAIAEEIAADCLAVRARVLSRVLSGIYDKALQPLGLKTSQLNVLVVLARIGPCSPGDVGRVLRLEKSTLSRNVERMARQGWVELQDAEDRRSHLLALTPAGGRLLRRARPRWNQAQQTARRALGGEAAAALLGMGSRALGAV